MSTTQPTRRKSKTLSVVLAVFFGPWTWLYTYGRDSSKLWIALIVGVCAVFLVAFTVGALAGATMGGEPYSVSDKITLWAIEIALLVEIMAIPAVWAWAIIDASVKKSSWYSNYNSY
ncbi:MAG: hypothetical protein Q8O40_03475 [Chloroflexota bacterium]|nr:hypothetical protein [Chloroflexota bacterium]